MARQWTQGGGLPENAATHILVAIIWEESKHQLESDFRSYDIHIIPVRRANQDQLHSVIQFALDGREKITKCKAFAAAEEDQIQEVRVIVRMVVRMEGNQIWRKINSCQI